MRDATSADVARAICLRGLIATRSKAIVFEVDGSAGGDTFEGPWEELPRGVQAYWLTTADLVDRVTRTPGWSGSLTPDVADYVAKKGGGP